MAVSVTYKSSSDANQREKDKIVVLSDMAAPKKPVKNKKINLEVFGKITTALHIHKK